MKGRILSTDVAGFTVLHEAVGDGDLNIEVAKLLVEAGKESDAFLSTKGETPLMIACLGGNQCSETGTTSHFNFRSFAF